MRGARSAFTRGCILTRHNDLICYLIAHRQALSRGELARLEAESAKLLDRLKRVEQEKLVEELRCFKDVLPSLTAPALA